MTIARSFRAVASLWTAAVLLTLIGFAPRVLGGDLKLEAQLVWGTNDPKPDDPDLTELDRSLRAKLCEVFKWKNYFVVRKQTFDVTGSTVKEVKMSPKCRLEVQHLGKNWVAVKLFGRKKSDSKEELVVTRKEQVKPGELLVLAGDDINDTAWFVLLSPPGK